MDFGLRDTEDDEVVTAVAESDQIGFFTEALHPITIFLLPRA